MPELGITNTGTSKLTDPYVPLPTPFQSELALVQRMHSHPEFKMPSRYPAMYSTDVFTHMLT